MCKGCVCASIMFSWSTVNYNQRKIHFRCHLFVDQGVWNQTACPSNSSLLHIVVPFVSNMSSFWAAALDLLPPGPKVNVSSAVQGQACQRKAHDILYICLLMKGTFWEALLPCLWWDISPERPPAGGLCFQYFRSLLNYQVCLCETN
ncbi:hypothetical protein ILYODFUR_031862 [Ilyodon furcidens]|uniref:Uncharacterized protein n=1 Tax=Ilyodon furcidens TaxID=33524 RepID=A0ABV0TD00_9TELE